MPTVPVDPGARERLLDATDRLLASRGFRRMTVAQVAAAAEVGKGSVYLHFASKDDLALACLDRMAERVLARMQRIARGAEPPRQRVRAMLRARVLDRFDYARRHAPSIDEKLAVMRQPLLARRARHFAAEAAALAGVLRAHRLHAAPERAAESLVIATNALLPYSLSVRELGRRPALLQRLDDLVDLLMSCLTPAAARGRRSNPRRIR
jgi:AcrR family transcriptional regulator